MQGKMAQALACRCVQVLLVLKEPNSVLEAKQLAPKASKTVWVAQQLVAPTIKAPVLVSKCPPKASNNSTSIRQPTQATCVIT